MEKGELSSWLSHRARPVPIFSFERAFWKIFARKRTVFKQTHDMRSEQVQLDIHILRAAKVPRICQLQFNDPPVLL
jgi:hypothetical protein